MVFIFLDPADLLPRDDRVALPDLIGPGLLVVVVAGVLVAVPGSQFIGKKFGFSFV